MPSHVTYINMFINSGFTIQIVIIKIVINGDLVTFRLATRFKTKAHRNVKELHLNETNKTYQLEYNEYSSTHNFFTKTMQKADHKQNAK